MTNVVNESGVETLPEPEARLAGLRHIALDLDGTLYRGGTLFPWTRPFLEQLDRLGIGYTFLTNNASKSVKDYLSHLKRLGLPASASRIYTSTLSTIEYLKEAHPEVKRLHVLGTASMRAEMAEAGYAIVDDDPELVVVSFPTDLTYQRLARTAYWISQGCAYVATHPDRTCPTDEPLVLVDCGAFCACFEAATGQRPVAVLGKPDPIMLRGILDRHGLQPNQLAMVGDRLETDVRMGRNGGVLSVLVLSGAASAEDAGSSTCPPDLVYENVGGLGNAIERARQ